MIDPDIAALLEQEAARINSPDFIGADPVQFPRRFDRLQDIEIVSLLASHIAWGNRKMICRDAERLLRMMEYQPWEWVREGAFEEVADEQNIHRTFFGRNLKHFLRGLKMVMERHGSLDEFCRASGAPQSETPSWELARALNEAMLETNGREDSRCLPLNLQNTALKRLNMALRWLVRRDGIVDMGVWRSLEPSQLFIPLDVHAGNTARELGLLQRKANDRRATLELTDVCRQLRPDDPALYDYALFGMGVSASGQQV